MANILHGSARTTPRIRAELQGSQEKTSVLARQYGLSRTTIAKWGAPARQPKIVLWVRGNLKAPCFLPLRKP